MPQLGAAITLNARPDADADYFHSARYELSKLGSPTAVAALARQHFRAAALSAYRRCCERTEWHTQTQQSAGHCLKQ